MNVGTGVTIRVDGDAREYRGVIDRMDCAVDETTLSPRRFGTACRTFMRGPATVTVTFSEEAK